MTDETTTQETKGGFVPKALVYSDMGPQARPISAWWLIPQLLLMGIICIVIVAILAIVGVIIAIAGGTSPDSLQDPTSAEMLPVILLATVGVFVGFWIVSFIKTKMEGRSLASMGIDGFMYGGRFWKNFFLGVPLALILVAPTILLGVDFGMEPPTELDFSRLATPGFAIGMLCMLGFLLIQAPSEEVLFRGWMFSGLSARHGIGFALIVSSVLFGLFHGDRFIVGPIFGIYYVIATTALGILFAAVSKATGSVIPACGLHTGYNFTLFAMGIAMLTAATEEGSFLESFMESLDLSNISDPAMSGPLIADMALRFIIPVALALWVLGRAKKNA
jgi:membrane protease YdiL (CAAX protease family)